METTKWRLLRYLRETTVQTQLGQKHLVRAHVVAYHRSSLDRLCTHLSMQYAHGIQPRSRHHSIAGAYLRHGLAFRIVFDELAVPVNHTDLCSAHHGVR